MGFNCNVCLSKTYSSVIGDRPKIRSDSNKKRVEKLIHTGEMTKAGLEKIEAAKTNGSWDKIITATRSFEMPIELKSALSKKQKLVMK